MMSWINFSDFQDCACATVLSSSTIFKILQPLIKSCSCTRVLLVLPTAQLEGRQTVALKPCIR